MNCLLPNQLKMCVSASTETTSDVFLLVCDTPACFTSCRSLSVALMSDSRFNAQHTHPRATRALLYYKAVR